eukprot:1391015-Ditylum_brightwellii.AAC.1
MQQSSSSPFGPSLPVLLPDYDPTKPHWVVLPEYDSNNLTSIGLYQCADWDETHPKAKIGVTMKRGRDFEYEFAKDSSGKINFSTDALYHNLTPMRTIYKHNSESHFLFGVATVKLPT